jgi:hypothetical protein
MTKEVGSVKRDERRERKIIKRIIELKEYPV